MLDDIGNPPNIERAKEIVSQIPVDIQIVGPGLNWSSDPDFPYIDEVPYGPMSLLELGEASQTEMEEWVKRLELVEFARFEEHNFIKLQQGEYMIVFASPKIQEQPAPFNTWLIFSIVGVLVLFLCYLAVRWLFKPIKLMQDGTERIGHGELDFSY